MKYLSVKKMILVSACCILATSALASPSGYRGTQTTNATGDGVNDFSACDEDGRVVCPFYYTTGVSGLAPEADWVEQAAALGYSTGSAKLSLISCFNANSAYTSQACKDSLSRRAALNTNMMAACLWYCADAGIVTSPGSSPCADYLVSIEDQLDATCKAALDAHEAAKPTTTHSHS